MDEVRERVSADDDVLLRLRDWPAMPEGKDAFNAVHVGELHEEAAVEIERLRKMLAGQYGDLQLVRAGPVGDMFMFELSSGHMSFIAEYLAQCLAYRHENEELLNHAEVKVQHPEIGMLSLTLQRLEGKTPKDMQYEAERQRDRLKEALRVNVLRLAPKTSHEEIDAKIEELCRG